MNHPTTLEAPRPVSRREAMRRGRRTYIGRPCRVHGAGVLRYATSSACCSCALASANATRERERAMRLVEMDDEDFDPN
jgi:hypothetical protein